jgi:hypothetical protein
MGNLLQNSTANSKSYVGPSFQYFAGPNSDTDASATNTFEKTMGNSLTFGSINCPVFIPGYLMLDYENDISIDSNMMLGQGGTAKIFMGKFENLNLIAKHGNLNLVSKIMLLKESCC